MLFFVFISMCDAHKHCLLLFIKWTFQTTNEQERKTEHQTESGNLANSYCSFDCNSIFESFKNAFFFLSRHFVFSTVFFVCYFSRSFSTLRFWLKSSASNRHNKINFIFTVALRNISNKIYTYTKVHSISDTHTLLIFLFRLNSSFCLSLRLLYTLSFVFFFFSFSDSISVSGNCFYFIIFS